METSAQQSTSCNQTQSAGKCFLDLPSEIRNMIYNLAAQQTKLHPLDGRKYKKHMTAGSALMETCKIVRQECEPILLQHASFNFQVISFWFTPLKSLLQMQTSDTKSLLLLNKRIKLILVLKRKVSLGGTDIPNRDSLLSWCSVRARSRMTTTEIAGGPLAEKDFLCRLSITYDAVAHVRRVYDEQIFDHVTFKQYEVLASHVGEIRPKQMRWDRELTRSWEAELWRIRRCIDDQRADFKEMLTSFVSTDDELELLDIGCGLGSEDDEGSENEDVHDGSEVDQQSEDEAQRDADLSDVETIEDFSDDDSETSQASGDDFEDDTW